MTGIEIAVIGLVAASTIVTAAGQIQQGRAARAAANAQAAAMAYQAQGQERQAEMLESKAGQERAVTQRRMIEERRAGRIERSNIQASAAASGAGALDPTVVNLTADSMRNAELRALGAFYEGEEVARGLEYDATLTRAGARGLRAASIEERRAGKRAQRNAYWSAFGTILQGGASAAGMYAPGGAFAGSKATTATGSFGRAGAGFPYRYA